LDRLLREVIRCAQRRAMLFRLMEALIATVVKAR